MTVGRRCARCGALNPQLAVGWSSDHAFEYTGSDKCMSCRHGKRPGAQVRPAGLAALKDLLWSMNKRKGGKKR